MNALDIAVLRASSASPDSELLNEYNSRLTQNIVCTGPGELAANLLLVAGGRSARHLQAIHNAVITLVHLCNRIYAKFDSITIEINPTLTHTTVHSFSL